MNERVWDVRPEARGEARKTDRPPVDLATSLVCYDATDTRIASDWQRPGQMPNDKQMIRHRSSTG